MARPSSTLIAAGMCVAVVSIVGYGVGIGAFDTVPPTLHVRVPPGPHTGFVPLQVELLDRVPGVGALWLSVDSGPPRRVSASECWVDTRALAEGTHTVHLRAEDASLMRNATQWTGSLRVDHPPPDFMDPRPLP